MNCWQRYSQNVVYKWAVSPLPPPSSVSMGFGNVMFGKSYTHSCSVFVWLFSDERRSVQPSNQVHWGLHRPSQHLHRNGVLSQRQPAGNRSWHFTFTHYFLYISWKGSQRITFLQCYLNWPCQNWVSLLITPLTVNVCQLLTQHIQLSFNSRWLAHHAE